MCSRVPDVFVEELQISFFVTFQMCSGIFKCILCAIFRMCSKSHICYPCVLCGILICEKGKQLIEVLLVVSEAIPKQGLRLEE